VICVDSSVAAKWLFAEEHSDKADALLQRALAVGEPVVVPPLLLSEVTNIVRQRMRKEALPLEEAQGRLSMLLAVPLSIHAPDTLYHDALALADRHNLPATYDAHYIALAQLFGATFWTADEKLVRALGGKLSFVRPIALYDVSNSSR